MSSTPLTEDTIREALRDCYDLEFPCNIVDLGLLDAITIAPDLEAPGAGIAGVPPRHRVHISLTLTTTPDPTSLAATQLIAQIQGRLAAFETISQAEITLGSYSLWTPDRISSEGRQRLALKQSPRRSQLVQIK